MSEALRIMVWPLVACLVLPGLLVYLGLHIVQREVIFVDLALAQVSALGICVCVMLGHEAREAHTYFWSAGFTLIGALIFSLTRNVQNRQVPQEALIGIVYVVAAALGILLLSRSAEGNEELRRALVGDVLLVRRDEILKTFVAYVLIGAIHWVFRRQFLILSFDPQGAVAQGLAVGWWDFLFYALFGLVVTSFVQIGGVLLVFSYLIVPAVCANFLAESLAGRLAVGWAVATLGGLTGIYGSYELELPTGAAIVCALGLALLLAGGGAWVRRRRLPPGPARDGSRGNVR
jgi:zinc/manganese transport system permease protein